MSNRKTKSLAKQSGSVGVYWDQMRGEDSNLIGEAIPKMKPEKEAVQSLSQGLNGWFKSDPTTPHTPPTLKQDKFKLDEKKRHLLSEFLDIPDSAKDH